jgi:hypothetical protein
MATQVYRWNYTVSRCNWNRAILIPNTLHYRSTRSSGKNYSSPVNSCLLSLAQWFLISGPIGTHDQMFFFCSKTVYVFGNGVCSSASNRSSIIACVFIAVRTCLPSRCRALMGEGRQQGDLISLLLFFSLLSLFWRNKSRLMRSRCSVCVCVCFCVCVCVSPPYRC